MTHLSCAEQVLKNGLVNTCYPLDRIYSDLQNVEEGVSSWVNRSTTHSHLPKGGTAHNGLCCSTSIINQENIPTDTNRPS